MSNNRCKFCKSSKVKKKGMTSHGSQRWFCNKCLKSWSKNRGKYKKYNESKMFMSWMSGSSINKVANEFNLSKSQTYRILQKQLFLTSEINTKNLQECKYAAFDGKFLFGRKKTCLVLYDTQKNFPVYLKLVNGENNKCISTFLNEVINLGFDPIAVTVDGRESIQICFEKYFKNIIVQRCLFHIKSQIYAWVRIPPRNDFGKELVSIVNQIMSIESPKQVKLFDKAIVNFTKKWETEIEEFYKLADIDKYRYRKEYDLTKCLSLLKNARKNMFQYLKDPNIARTTSGLEGFNKQISKIKSFDHNGLKKEHLEMFLKHYVNTKNRPTK